MTHIIIVALWPYGIAKTFFRYMKTQGLLKYNGFYPRIP